MLLPFNSNTMGATSGAETAYPSETAEFTHGFGLLPDINLKCVLFCFVVL